MLNAVEFKINYVLSLAFFFFFGLFQTRLFKVGNLFLAHESLVVLAPRRPTFLSRLDDRGIIDAFQALVRPGFYISKLYFCEHDMLGI